MNWMYRINIKDHLICNELEEDEITIEDMRKTAEGIRDAIATLPTHIRVAFARPVEGLLKCDNIWEFNNKWLNMLYDVADRRRVWLG
jgi:hypothetical protein